MKRRWATALLGALLLVLQLPAQATVPATDSIYLWESGGMTPETLAELEAIAEDRGLSVLQRHRGTLNLVRVARGEEVIQEPAPGFVIPMAALAIDPDQARPLIGNTIGDALASGGLVMGASSARLRGAEVGDAVTFEGWDGSLVTLDLVAIAADEKVRWNELIVSTDTAATFGFERLSSVSIWGFDDKDELFRDLVVAFVDESVGVDADPARGLDDVLPNVLAKRYFGEFSYRYTGPGDRIEIDPEWVDANIVTVNLPLLGVFKCHRMTVPYLEAAIDEVIESGLSGIVDSADFQLAGGCYNPRRIRGGDKGGALSRHSWGFAIDINPSTNPYGGVVAMDPQVAEIFRRWGFAWGGGWVFSDGAHFEWTRFPVDVNEA